MSFEALSLICTMGEISWPFDSIYDQNSPILVARGRANQARPASAFLPGLSFSPTFA
jgi:hypothetical protein